MAEHGDPILPLPARVLDALGLVLLGVGCSAIMTGGFREWTPLGRLSVTSAVRPIVLGAAVLVLRHWIWRRPSVMSRIVAAVRHQGQSDEARVVWPVVVSTRVGVLLVGFLGIVLLGYPPGAPPYRIYNNDFLDMPARWDTGWYMGIATGGYSFVPGNTDAMQNIAFFPLYPILTHYVGLFAARQVIWVGVAISLAAFSWAMFYLFRLARAHLDSDAAAASVALLAAYPFALFYSAAYTEALFLLTIVAACFHFERHELWKAGAWGLAAGLTRPNGCLLSVVLALMAVRDYRVSAWGTLSRRLATAAGPGVGMLIFSTYIYFLTGNPLQWAAQHAAWGRVYGGLGSLVGDRVAYIQVNGLYNYASTLTLDMINAIATVFILGSVWPVYRRFGVPYAAMILVNALVPLLAGGMLSMGRITSVMFPAFLWLGAVIPARHRIGWLIGFAMLQAVFAMAFFTWRPLY